jgi:hypothetical protein
MLLRRRQGKHRFSAAFPNKDSDSATIAPKEPPGRGRRSLLTAHGKGQTNLTHLAKSERNSPRSTPSPRRRDRRLLRQAPEKAPRTPPLPPKHKRKLNLDKNLRGILPIELSYTYTNPPGGAGLPSTLRRPQRPPEERGPADRGEENRIAQSTVEGEKRGLESRLFCGKFCAARLVNPPVNILIGNQRAAPKPRRGAELRHGVAGRAALDHLVPEPQQSAASSTPPRWASIPPLPPRPPPAAAACERTRPRAPTGSRRRPARRRCRRADAPRAPAPARTCGRRRGAVTPLRARARARGPRRSAAPPGKGNPAPRAAAWARAAAGPARARRGTWRRGR